MALEPNAVLSMQLVNAVHLEEGATYVEGHGKAVHHNRLGNNYNL